MEDKFCPGCGQHMLAYLPDFGCYDTPCTYYEDHNRHGLISALKDAKHTRKVINEILSFYDHALLEEGE